MASPGFTKREFKNASATRVAKALDKSNEAFEQWGRFTPGELPGREELAHGLWAIACELRVANAIALLAVEPPDHLFAEADDE